MGGQGLVLQGGRNTGVKDKLSVKENRSYVRPTPRKPDSGGFWYSSVQWVTMD